MKRQKIILEIGKLAGGTEYDDPHDNPTGATITSMALQVVRHFDDREQRHISAPLEHLCNLALDRMCPDDA